MRTFSVSQKISRRCQSPSSNRCVVLFSLILSSSVPEPKSINNLGLPDSNSNAIKSVCKFEKKKKFYFNGRQGKLGANVLTWNESLFRFRWHHWSVVEQRSIRFLGEELDAKVRTFTHFQRRIPGPSSATESACRLLTARPVITTGTLTSTDNETIRKMLILKNSIKRQWRKQRTWRRNGLRCNGRHCGKDYCDSFRPE